MSAEMDLLMESAAMEIHKLESHEEPAKEIKTDQFPVSQNIPFNKGIIGETSAGESHKLESHEELVKEIQTDQLPVSQNTPCNKGVSDETSAEQGHKLESHEELAKERQTDQYPGSQNIPSNKGISGEASAVPRVGDEYQAQVPDPVITYHNELKMATGIPIIWSSHGSNEENVPLPGLYNPSAWSESQKEVFILGLYIFGKRLNMVRWFMEGESKTMGDVLSYYYGDFYKSDLHKRFKIKNCVLGHRIFQGWRQDHILSRFAESTCKESHDALQEVFKAYNEERFSFEDFIFALKAVVGAHTLVQVISIGKGKHDLTKVRSDPSRGRNPTQPHLDMPVGKEWSSLPLEEIIKFLTGGFRLGKSRSNDLFWEAVWPRLLVKGWISVQPKDHALTFVIPGIDCFPREDLVKGIHYFDSVTDLLSKVASDPNLICVPDNGGIDDGAKNYDIKSSCIRPKLQISELNLMKFTVIDTSIFEREGVPCKIRALRSLPLDTFTNTHLLDEPKFDRSVPESSGVVDSPNESIDIVKEEPVKLNIEEKNALENAKSKFKKCAYKTNATKFHKRRLGSSKIGTCENGQSNPHYNAQLSLNNHFLEPEVEAKGISQASQPSVDLNLLDLSSASEENNEKERTNSINNRRHGTRNRPPTTKALESLALGFLGTGKRKDSEVKSCSSRPTRQARKSVGTVISDPDENVPMVDHVSPYACGEDLIEQV